MKSVFKRGDFKKHEYQVQKTDFASFESGLVHPVCSTFSLGREMEWSSRLFMLEVTDADEEGIGTMLEVIHQGPAFEGEILNIDATIERIEGNEIICEITVRVGSRPIARGKTGQKVLKKEKINQIFTRLGK